MHEAMSHTAIQHYRPQIYMYKSVLYNRNYSTALLSTNIQTRGITCVANEFSIDSSPLRQWQATSGAFTVQFLVIFPVRDFVISPPVIQSAGTQNVSFLFLIDLGHFLKIRRSFHESGNIFMPFDFSVDLFVHELLEFVLGWQVRNALPE